MLYAHASKPSCELVDGWFCGHLWWWMNGPRNSSVQCLSNIPHLRQFFLDGTYKVDKIWFLNLSSFQLIASLVIKAFAAPFVKFQQDDLNRSAHKTEGKLAESFAELSGPLVHWVQLGKICLDRDYMGWIQVGDDVEADHHRSSLAATP